MNFPGEPLSGAPPIPRTSIVARHIAQHYGDYLKLKGGKRPKKPESKHCALSPKDLEAFRDNWKLLKSCFPPVPPQRTNFKLKIFRRSLPQRPGNETLEDFGARATLPMPSIVSVTFFVRRCPHF